MTTTLPKYGLLFSILFSPDVTVVASALFEGPSELALVTVSVPAADGLEVAVASTSPSTAALGAFANVG